MKIIYTDLDGSLLDHQSYSFAPAANFLERLEIQAVPVIPVTSKTRAEVLALRKSLNNRHPFIVENGAAICLPNKYFDCSYVTAPGDEDIQIICNSQPRQYWLDLLDQAGGAFTDEYQTFSSICAEKGIGGLVELTGLSLEQATLAQQREYSEPIHWLGSQTRKAEFIHQIEQAGGQLLQGGRFLTLGGNTNKGAAVLQLQALFRQQYGSCQSLAIGDSNNDISMLEAADSALIIRSEHHRAPIPLRDTNLWHSHAAGPNGWVEGVNAWLSEKY